METFKVRSERKSADRRDAVERRKFQNVSAAIVGTELKNRMVEKEKMSKLFTKNRRIKARADFDQRVKYNLEKARVKKKELQKKYYNYDFTPKINKNKGKRKVDTMRMNDTTLTDHSEVIQSSNSKVNRTVPNKIQRNHFKTDDTITEVSGSQEVDSSRGVVSRDFGYLNTNNQTVEKFNHKKNISKGIGIESKLLEESKMSSEGYIKHRIEPSLELDISSQPHFNEHAMAPHSQISQIPQTRNPALTNLYTQGSFVKTDIVNDSQNYQYSITQLDSTDSMPFHIKDSLYKHNPGKNSSFYPTPNPRIQKSHMPNIVRVQTGNDSQVIDAKKQINSFISTKRSSAKNPNQRRKNNRMEAILTTSQERPPTFGEGDLPQLRANVDSINPSFKGFDQTSKNNRTRKKTESSNAFEGYPLEPNVTNLESDSESQNENQKNKKESSPFESLDYFDAEIGRNSGDPRKIFSSDENNQMEVNM